MEDLGAIQASTPTASTPVRSTCSTCGGTTPVAVPNQAYVTLFGQATISFANLSQEREFAQLLGKKDFKGFTDPETLHSVLTKKENVYLARKMCPQFTVYGTGSSPNYILEPETASELDLILDTLKRPAGSAETVSHP